MSKLFTRQEFRDQIRRMLQIVPPVDYLPTPGNAGDQPTNAPVPTNQQINDALQHAISDINRECQFHVNGFTVPVSAVDASVNGPLAISLTDLTPTTSPARIVTPDARINDVLRVLWTPTGGVPVILQPTTRYGLDRNNLSDYYADVPSAPERWYVESYTLFVTPSPSQTGTFTLTCGTGITGLQCENDVLDQVPIDFQTVFMYQAIVRLSKTMTGDVEATERAQMFAADAMLGMRQMKAWREGTSGAPQSSLAFVSYRTGYGTRRVRR